MNKVIHYCWFGGKPLSSMAKKCIKSWKKFLPNYEIKQWDETNFDINICPFVKEAYENKKWAFVSDYARIYALYNEGGIYFDTDMKILKDISGVTDKPMFLGYEDSGYIGTAVIGVAEKHNDHIKEILEYYNNLEHFYIESIYNYANPVIITNILNKYDYEIDNNIKIIDNNVYIYSRDYFYPLSYNYDEKIFTDNTCMVHLFMGSWTSKGERRTNIINRIFGMSMGSFINKTINKIFEFKYKIIYKIKSKYNSLVFFYSIHFHRNKRVYKIKEELSKQTDNYVALCHPEWIGVKNATMNAFGKNVLEVREQYNDKEAKMVAEAIVNAKKNLVIFNAFAIGWEKIINSLKDIKPDIKIKLISHGGNSLLAEGYDWNVQNIIWDLYKKGKIDELAFVKKSLYEFYKAKGYRSSFLMNDVTIDSKERFMPREEIKDDFVKVGLYSSGDRWVKNTYNQISAVGLLKNAKLDCVAINNKISTLARVYDIKLTGKNYNISKEELYKRMAQNDINLYVTFTECAPLIPLESLELGVICITGNNHHYFEGTELEKYLVVNKPDDIMAIYSQINYALENKEKILALYKEWKKEYTKEVKNSIEEFLKN